MKIHSERKIIIISLQYIIQINKTMIGPFVETEQHQEELKNSKIVQRKQIEKRLQGLKPSEYEKIIQNLKSQNEKLRLEVKTISAKVEELMQSRKIVKNKNPQIEAEIMRLRKELDLKYESMSYLKESVKKLNQSEMTEEMKMKIQERTNTVMQYQKQFRELQKQRDSIKAQIDKNEQDIKQFMPPDASDGKIQSLKAENRQIRQKINNLKQQLTNQEKNSKQIIGKLYHLKDEEKKEKGLTKVNREISMSLKEIKTTSLSEITQLEKEIESLKSKKQEVEKDLATDKIIKEAKKGKMEKEIKNLLQFHKELYKRRVKGVNQLNYYEQREIQLEQQLQKQAQISNVTYQEADIQTIKVVPVQFRKEWFGKGEGTPFNDASILQFRGQSLIKAATVYKTPENIVWVKFHYESPEKKKYESEPPFQKFILKKCQSRKYESKNGAALAKLTVSAHAGSKKIVKIELGWGDGEVSVVGWDMQGSTKYPFDIKENQRPVCMFGTINTIGKFSYVLESLGCEINTIDD